MKNLIVDNTLLSLGRQCWRKLWYRQERGFVLPTVEAPLNFGGAIHAGMAHFLRTGNLDESQAVALKALKPQVYDEEEFRTPDLLIKVLDVVLKGQLPTPLRAPNGEPIVEVDFIWPLCETEEERAILGPLLNRCGYDDAYYAGIVDLLGLWDNKEMVVDHKTKGKLEGNTRKGETKRIPAKWWDTFNPHAATPMYCWGISKILGRPIRTIMINGIGFDPYGVAMGRHIFELTPSQVEEAKRRVIREVQLYLFLKSQGIMEEVFNPDACHNFNRPCPYLTLCRMPKENRASLESLYQIDPWDPLTQRRKEAAEIYES